MARKKKKARKTTGKKIKEKSTYGICYIEYHGWNVVPLEGVLQLTSKIMEKRLLQLPERSGEMNETAEQAGVNFSRRPSTNFPVQKKK